MLRRRRKEIFNKNLCEKFKNRKRNANIKD